MEFLENMPEEILSWQLKGSGLENIGTKGRPDTVPFPRYSEDDLIARIDTVGLCFSDIKLISAGGTHPRIEGRNLAKNPTVPGHEVAMTIVGVGENRKAAFKLGSRFIIQADIFYKGKGVAFGYAIPGGLSQYVVIGKEVLDGDEGCYLLPVKDSTGFAEAALVEPWTCVIASYQIRARTAVKEGGWLHFAGFSGGQVPLDLSGLVTGKIARITHSGLSAENLRAVEELARTSGVTAAAAGSFVEGQPGPTDVVIAGTRIAIHSRTSRMPSSPTVSWACTPRSPRWSCPSTWERCTTASLSSSGPPTGRWRPAIAPTRGRPFSGKAARGSWAGRGPWARCTSSRPSWTRTVPRRSSSRISPMSGWLRLKHLVTLLCKDRHCEVPIAFENPKDLPADELDTFLTGKYPGGFDDVIVLVPVTAIISQASHYLAPGGVLNIFAGVKVGTITDLPFGAIVKNRMRVIGSSGSPLAAMRDTLSLTESGRLSTSYSLAAIGDMGSASKGLKALMDNSYTGKVVIFPFAHGMGLKSIKEIAKELPEIAPLLLDGQYWTRAAEAAFLKSKYFT